MHQQCVCLWYLSKTLMSHKYYLIPCTHFFYKNSSCPYSCSGQQYCSRYCALTVHTLNPKCIIFITWDPCGYCTQDLDDNYTSNFVSSFVCSFRSKPPLPRIPCDLTVAWIELFRCITAIEIRTHHNWKEESKRSKKKKQCVTSTTPPDKRA